MSLYYDSTMVNDPFFQTRVIWKLGAAAPIVPQYAVDISEYQGLVNYALLKSKSLGVIHRASIGTNDDDNFQINWVGLEGTQRGAYHYFVSYLTGVYQAENFLGQIEGKTPMIWNGQEWIPGFVVDCEHNDPKLSPSALAARIKAFILHVRFYRPELAACVYTRGEWWNTNVGTAEQAFFGTCILWIARYSNFATHPWDNNPNSILRPKPWNQYAMWQWSADGNNQGDDYGVESDDIDLDKLNGFTPPPDPTPIPPGAWVVRPGYVSGPNGCNLRRKTLVDPSTLVKLMPQGEQLLVYGAITAINGYSWYVVRDSAGDFGVAVQTLITLE